MIIIFKFLCIRYDFLCSCVCCLCVWVVLVELEESFPSTGCAEARWAASKLLFGGKPRKSRTILFKNNDKFLQKKIKHSIKKDHKSQEIRIYQSRYFPTRKNTTTILKWLIMTACSCVVVVDDHHQQPNFFRKTIMKLKVRNGWFIIELITHKKCCRNQ